MATRRRPVVEPARAELDSNVDARLRAAGQRTTSNRARLVSILASAGQPLSMPEILARGRGLAQSSVYRNLAVLEEAKVVRRITTADEFARFELAEDLTGHHHHLVCASCGLVEDLPASITLERTVRDAMAEAITRANFSPRGHRLDVIGLCARCS